MSEKFLDKLDFSPQMIGQQLAKLLTDAIVRNEIQGGEKLVEHQLQKKFGVSRSPIREAIRDLEKIGLVEIIPRKGTVVREITQKEVIEDYTVRAPLEGLAAKHAFRNMDKSDLTRLGKAKTAMGQAVKNNDPRGYWQAHADFHNIFINACGIGLLTAILNILRIHSLRSRYVFPYPDEDISSSLKTHEVLMKKFKSPDTDTDELEAFVTQHILDALPGFLKNMRKKRAL